MSESVEPRSGTWKVSQCPFVIEYDLDILEEITRDVQEGFQALPHGGLERGGLLLGQREKGRLHISGHEPFPCEYASGPSFHLSERDRRGLSERIEHYDSLTEDDAPRVVGWYHSHTRSPLALSTEDLSVHYKLFTDHSLVALLLRPEAGGGARAGFFFREPGGASIRTSGSYLEFTIEPPAAPAFVPAPRGALSRRTSEGGGGGTATATARAPYPAPLAPEIQPAVPAFAMAGRPEGAKKSRFAVTAVLAALFAIALGAVVYLRVFYAPQTTLAPAPEQLRLEAVHREGNLEITWDTRSLGNVKEGQLDIQDGPIKARLLLDARTLWGGSVSYAYKSDVTGFRLHVQREDGTALEGSSTYVVAKDAVRQAEVKSAAEELARLEAESSAPDPAGTAAFAAKTPDVVQRVETPAPQAATAADRVTTPEPARKTFEPPAVRPKIPVRTGEPVVIAPPVVTAQQSSPIANLQLPGAGTPQAAPPPPAPKPQTTTQGNAATATPVTPAPRPLQLTGRWTLQPGSVTRSPSGMPDTVLIDIVESATGLRGTLDARYKGGKNEHLQLNFAGRVVNGVARFPWTGKDGKTGEIEFIRVPGQADQFEIVFYGADPKQIYDHIVRRAN